MGCASVLFIFDKGKVEGEQAVHEALEVCGEAKVIQGKTPNDEIGLFIGFEKVGHVVFDDARAGRFIPAGETAFAGLYVLSVGFDKGDLVGVAHSLEKGIGKAHGIAFCESWASV